MDQRSRTLIKNKEQRKIRADILLSLPRLTEEQIGDLLPSKSQVTMTKLANRSILYSVDGIPLFLDVLGRNTFVPTVYTLWRYPSIVRTFVVHSPVSEYVLRGADLMLPGVVRGTVAAELSDLKKGEVVCIRVNRNPVPFAVGTAETSWEHIVSQGMKGRGVSVLHIFGDELWKNGGSLVPNDGFGLNCVHGTEDIEEIDAEEIQDEETNEDVHAEVVKENGTTEIDVKHTSDEDEGNNDGDGIECDISIPLIYCTISPSSTPLPVSTPSSGTSSLTSTPLEEDIAFERNLLVALKYHIKDKQLPMLASTFWSNVTKYSAGVFDIKKSKFKKVSVFLQHYQSQQLLSLSDKNGVIMVNSVNRGHDLFRGIKLSDQQMESAEISEARGDQNHVFGWSKMAHISDSKIKVLSLYKFPRPAKDLFGNVKGEYGEYLQKWEVRDVIMMYLKNSQYGSLLECDEDKSKVSISVRSDIGKFLYGKCGGLKEKMSIRTMEESGAGSIEDAFYSDTLEQDEDIGSRDDAGCEDDDEFQCLNEANRSDGSFVAGVWVPPISSSYSSSDVSNDCSRKALKGSSSVGGWGLDPGQKWRPITLPKEPFSVTMKGASFSSTQAQKKKTKSDSRDTLSEVEDTRIIRKDELMTIVLSRLISYSALVNANGEVKINSGGPPKVSGSYE